MSEKERATKQEQVTLPDGRVGWSYSDGSIRDGHGSFMVPHPNGAPPITAANSAKMRQKRSEKYAAATVRGALASVRKNLPTQFIPGTLAAWQAMGEQVTDILFDPKAKDRDRIDAYKAISTTGDLVPGRVPAADQGQPVGSADFEIEVLELIYRRAKIKADRIKQDQVIESELVDVDE